MEEYNEVLNEINREYIDSGIRAAFIMKRFTTKYKINSEIAVKLVLLCMLKDIGFRHRYIYYNNEFIKVDL